MTERNYRMRAALRDIEGRATAALANQPTDNEECGRHLSKALAGIELTAHNSRWGDVYADFPPLKYAGGGQIVNTTTHELVSPRLVAELYNRLVAERKREAAAGADNLHTPPARRGEEKSRAKP